MLQIEKLKKRYYCPLKENRLVDDSNNDRSYQHIKDLIFQSAPSETFPDSVFYQTHGLGGN
jgi:hypothetical protein